MKQLMTVEGLRVHEKGKLVVPHHTEGDAGAPVNGEIIADKETGYGKIYVNGRWVLFGQDSMPLVGLKSSAYTQTGSAYVPTDTSAGSFVVTLDALPTPGDRITFIDIAKTWYTQNLVIRSHKNIDGSSNDLRVNVNGGAIELLYVDDTIGYAIVDGEAKTDESTFLGIKNISTDATALPRYEYMVTSAASGIDLTLPASAPEGALIRLTDGAGRAASVSIRMVTATAILNGNRTSYELGNAYGSVTVEGRTVGGTYRWFVIQENAYAEPVGFGAVTSTTALTNREDCFIPVNTTGGQVQVTLPNTPRPFQRITFYDHSATWHRNGFLLNFGAKSSSSHGANHTFREYRGFVSCIYNVVTDNWEVQSNEVSNDVLAWSNQTGNFTASAYVGYRVSTTSSFTITLPDPTGLPLDAVIRINNTSDTTQTQTNMIFIRTVNAGHLIGGPLVTGGNEQFEFRVVDSGTAYTWFLASKTGAPALGKLITSSATAYAGYNYHCDFTSNATITLDGTYTKNGDDIFLFDPDGGWAGRTITVVPGIGSIDGHSSMVFKKGHARLLFRRVHGGFALVSERYDDFRNVSSASTQPKLNDWMHGIHAWSRNSTSFTAVEGFFYNVQSASKTPLRVTLPTPTTPGAQIGILDEYGRCQRYPIEIFAGTDMIASGRNYLRLASNGGMFLFEARYDNSALRWYPVLTPEGDNKYMEDVNEWSPGPNTLVPINAAGTLSLPTNATQGDTVTVFEYDYRRFRSSSVSVRATGNQELMNVANRTFVIPPEMASVTFMFSEDYNSWLITDSALRIDTSTSKLDLVTNLTWVDTTVAQTGAANTGYNFNLAGMSDNRGISLPTSGIELNSVIAVATYGTNTAGHVVFFSGGTIDGITATSYESLRAPGEYVELVNRGNGIWITKNRSITHSKIAYPSSNTIALDFTDNVNTVERTITANSSVTATFPGGITTTFFILLRQDGSGNRNITLPSTWKKSAGSEEFNLTANAYNLIQGTHIGGKTFYNVTAYI